MATGLDRRDCLKGLLGLGLSPCVAWANTPPPGTARCVAAWDGTDGQHWVGLLQAGPGSTLAVLDALALPSRAHGLVAETDGSVLVLARRPGEWLLRWHPGTSRPPQWQWLSGPRHLSGHALAPPNSPWIYTVELGQDDAEGWLVARDRRSLAEQAAWPTGGCDPHMALADGASHVLVANGGVLPAALTQGRPGGVPVRSSLVRLSLSTGQQLGAWRLADQQLSMRHLARHAHGMVGIALQAEHEQAGDRQSAPLLALFDGQRLWTAQADPSLGGYGGDIAALAEGFVVSASRAPQARSALGALALWSLEGRLQRQEPWPLAGALDEQWAVGTVWRTPLTSSKASPARAKAWDNHIARMT